jgi:peptide-methionine (S)-S-oxide reductase
MSTFNLRRSLKWASLVALASVLVLGLPALYGAERAVPIAPPALDNPRAPGPMQVAVFSGGCFWGVQGVFEHVRGVRRVLAGYAGGEKSTAHYEQVSSGNTGHAESVQITFDPAQISFGQLLQVFFSVAHDPTQLNHQYPDFGTQYRSAIFYADDTQKQIAAGYIAQLNRSRAFSSPIVTRVDPLRGFYAAEEYHQDYLVHNPANPYIAINDLPKVENLKRVFPALYAERPVLAHSS